MNTVRLFDTDSYMFTFEAVCVSVQPHNDFFEIILDRTAFFPEAGGQKADTGTISYELDGETHSVRVEDVRENDGVISHFTKTAIPEGVKIHGVLDALSRFGKMQNHTAEHIISGIVHSEYGYANVGFHLADSYMTMDYDGPIDPDGIKELETLANIAASGAHKVNAWYPEDISKIEYRSKKELKGPIRIVEIEGIDTCACCAPHVRNTAEVGLIKITEAISYKGGVRITAVAGMRALETFQNAWDTLCGISKETSLPVDKTLEGVLKIKSDLADTKRELAKIKNAQIRAEIDKILNDSGFKYIIIDDSEELLNTFKILDAECDESFCVFAKITDENYRFMIKYDDNSFDIADFKLKLNANGGGKPGFLQGAAKITREKILKYFA